VWTGGSNTFTITSVREIVANGNGNTLKIGTLGELTINGDKNSFVWKQAKSGKEPEVQDNGKGNSVAKEKPAKAAPPKK
jgi:hypothetical protein